MGIQKSFYFETIRGKIQKYFQILSLCMSRNEISKLLKTSRNTIRKVENAAKSIRLF